MRKSRQEIFSLDGSVIIITGGAGILGVQHARAVAELGGTPILLDIDDEGLQSAVAKVRSEFSIDAFAYKVDITDERAVAENAKTILAQHKKINVLINNAANNPKMTGECTPRSSRLEEMSIEDWQNDLSVGLTGSFLSSKYYGTKIATNPKGGVIVNISSDLGLIAPDQRLYRNNGDSDENQPVKPASYSVVKSGLIGLTRYLATYWPGHVRCNALCPGGVENDQSREFLARLHKRIPMGRMAQPDEYISAIQFLCSDASSYMNGACLVIDGGRTCW